MKKNIIIILFLIAGIIALILLMRSVNLIELFKRLHGG